MTEKQERILEVALTLFSKDGFNGVSTAKIAKKAKVSEGLIFKHFKNKQGLLDAILKDLEIKLSEIILPVLEEKEDKKILNKAISGLLLINEDDFDFWKLQYKLKVDDNYDTRDKVQPYIDHLEAAFKNLGYENPDKEAYLLFEVVDAVFKQLVNNKMPNIEEFVSFLLTKYQLN